MSYGKVHRTFFRSSINDQDPIVRLIFIGMIVLSDREGALDITRSALARELNIVPGEIDRAIEILTSPDDSSRSPSLEGRRIVPIDPRRSWGWIVVNKDRYRQGDPDLDPDQGRVAARERKRKQRARERTESDSSFTKESPNTKEEPYTPSVTVTPCHTVSREKCDALFEKCWSLVPRKEGKLDARKYFDKDIRGIKSAGDVDAAFSHYGENLERAIRYYAELVSTRETQKIMHGSKLFLNFRDYAGKPIGRPARSAERAEGLAGLVV